MCVQTDESARTSPPSLTTKPSKAAVEKRVAAPGGSSARVATSSQKPSPVTRSSPPPRVGAPAGGRGATRDTDQPGGQPGRRADPALQQLASRQTPGPMPGRLNGTVTHRWWDLDGLEPGVGSAHPEAQLLDEGRVRHPRCRRGPRRRSRRPVGPSRPRRHSRRPRGRAGHRPGARRDSARSARPSGRVRQPSVASPISAALRSARYCSTLALPLVMPIACAVSATDMRWRKRSSSTRRYRSGRLPSSACTRIVALSSGGVGPLRAVVGRLPARRHVVDADDGQAIERAPVVGDRVLGDAVQPGGDLAGLAGGVELLDGSHEDLCGQVLGVRSVADAGVDEPIDADHVLAVDLLEATGTGWTCHRCVTRSVTAAVATGPGTRRSPRGSGRRSRRTHPGRSHRCRSRR